MKYKAEPRAGTHHYTGRYPLMSQTRGPAIWFQEPWKHKRARKAFCKKGLYHADQELARADVERLQRIGAE